MFLNYLFRFLFEYFITNNSFFELISYDCRCHLRYVSDMPGNHRDRRRNRNTHSSNALSSHHIFHPFGFGFGGSIMDDLFSSGQGGFTSISSLNTTFTNGAHGSGNSNIKRTSTSTRFVNGKKITTKRFVH